MERTSSDPRVGISLTWPRLSFPWEKKGEQISTSVVVLFLLNVFVLTPDARVFLITGNILECDAEPVDSSLRPNRTLYT